MIGEVVKSGKPACIYTPPDDKKKDELSKIKHVEDDEIDLGNGIQKWFDVQKIFCVHYGGGTEIFFKHFDLHDCWLVLDDYPTLCGDLSENRLLKRILPLLRRANVDLSVTAHFIEDDIPDKLRKLCTTILQFGPSDDPDEVNALIKLRRGDSLQYSKDEFKERLKNIEKYKYLKIR
jgi:hypothetical protein